MIAMQAPEIGIRQALRRPKTDSILRDDAPLQEPRFGQDLVEDGTLGYVVYRAVRPEDLRAACAFISGMRSRLGYPRPAMVSGEATATQGPPQTALFLAKSWPDIVGTSALAVGTPGAPLPAERTFPEIRSLSEQGFLCELIHRAMVPAYHRTSLAEDFLRCCVAQALLVGCTDMIMVVKPWERQRLATYGFTQVGPVRSSGGAVPEPSALVRLELTWLEGGRSQPRWPDQADAGALWRLYYCENPYRRHVAAWASQADSLVGSPTVHGAAAFRQEARSFPATSSRSGGMCA